MTEAPPPNSPQSHDAANGRVIDLRGWLSARRRFDDLRRLRPWGRGNVVQHDVAVGESRERPGQLRIERGWPNG